MDVSNAFDHFCVIFFIFSKMCQRVSAIRAVLVTSHCGPTYNGGGPVDVPPFDHFWEHVLMHLCFSVRVHYFFQAVSLIQICISVGHTNSFFAVSVYRFVYNFV